MSTPELMRLPAGELRRVTEDDFMPLLAAKKAIARKEALNQIISEVLIEGVDFGVQPGSANDQKVLKKSGAEKLISTFGLSPRIVSEEKIEDWTGEQHGGEPFFYYKYLVALYRGDMFMGEAGGSCNSWETKYRWRWITEAEAKDRPDFAKLPKRGGRRKIFEPDFALDKQETTGRYGKPAEYWQRFRSEIENAVSANAPSTAKKTKKQLGKREFSGWEIEVDDTLVRIPNPNAADVVNTVQKMAYKRALVAPVLVVTNCSDAFTQDLDEDEETAPTFTENPAPQGEESPAKSTETEPPPTKTERPTKAEAPAAAATTRVIPEELEIMVAAIKRDPRKELNGAYEMLWGQFQKRGTKAMKQHEELITAFRQRFPRGASIALGEHINLLLDLWEALQKFPSPQPKDEAAD